jgi:hypothetical protein
MGIATTLSVEGLTLKANTNSTNCGTAIYAKFGPGNANKFHTATIHNVQIIGSARDGTSCCYWTSGIHLYTGQNSVIDKVEISGNKNATQTGIVWDSSTSEPSTGLQLSNLEIKWCNTALLTNGYVEGLYMTGFEFISCGRSGYPAVSLSAYAGELGSAGSLFHLVNGQVDSIGDGITMTNLILAKISNVYFRHTGTEAADGTMLAINNVSDAIVSECTFYGVDNTVSGENGIFLTDSQSVRIAGNNFSHMQPWNNGSCIVVYGSSSVVRITDNLFSSFRQQYNDQAPLHDTYYLGNNP